MGIYSQARNFIAESQDQDSYDYKDINIIGTLMEAETEIKRVDQLVFESLLELDFVSIVEGEEGENKDSSNNNTNTSSNSTDDGKKANKIIEAFKTIWRKVKDAIIKAWNAFIQKIQEIINSKALKNIDNTYEMIKKSGVKSIKVEDMKLEDDILKYSYITYGDGSTTDIITKYIDKFKSLKFENDNELDDFLDELNNHINSERTRLYKTTFKSNPTTIDLSQLDDVVDRLKEKNVIKDFKSHIKKIEQELNQILNEVSKSKNNDNVAARKYKAGTKLLSAISEVEKLYIQRTKNVMSADRKIFIAFIIEAKKANKKGNDNTDNTSNTSTGESVDLTSSIIDLESDLYMESLFGF